MPRQVDLITFAVGDEHFGIELSVVEEVSANPALQPGDAYSAAVIGYTRRHDRLVPVIDLGELLEIAHGTGGAAGGATRVIIIRLADGSWVGLKVDGATEVRRGVPPPTPVPALYGKGPRAPLVHGLAESEGRIVPLLDMHSLLMDEKLRALPEAAMQP